MCNIWQNSFENVKKEKPKEERKQKTKQQKEKLLAQRGARTHDPEIKSLVLYRLS